MHQWATTVIVILSIVAVSTEDLRLALQRYRSFFTRLPSM